MYLRTCQRQVNDVENIFIINPRQTIGEESGRISIHELAIKLNQKDIVIWDNFPDDLLKRDIESAWEVLEIISVRDVTNLLVALKPKYLEIYRGVAKKVPELYDYEIGYDRQKISSIITSYGKNIIQFIDVYEKYVSPSIHQISTILWQKEPLPITILAYFRELVRKQNEMKGESIDAILEAQKLMHRTDYYKHQFALISNLEDRQNDIDFLYTLKLCYELSLSRDSYSNTPVTKRDFRQCSIQRAHPETQYMDLFIWTVLLHARCARRSYRVFQRREIENDQLFSREFFKGDWKGR